MAERIQVELVDDLDGSPASQTVTFALDGLQYEIDLSSSHAQKLRGIVGQYIRRARRVTRNANEDSEAESDDAPRKLDAQARRANKALTEQIRGAAQRTREHLSKLAAEPGAGAQEEAGSAAAGGEPVGKTAQVAAPAASAHQRASGAEFGTVSSLFEAGSGGQVLAPRQGQDDQMDGNSDSRGEKVPAVALPHFSSSS